MRSKRRIRDAGIPFAVPDRAAMPARLPDVLEAVYGAYAIDWQGIAAASERPRFATEALHLAETLAELLPEEPEVLGLAALIAHSLARTTSRIDESGVLVPVPEQDVERWDHALIDLGERYLREALALGRAGRFQLEAAIQAAHNDRRRSGVTDWSALHSLYVGLLEVAPTLGAAISFAAVIAETDGARAALDYLDAIDDPRVARFQPAWAVRAHLLAGAGDRSSAAEAYERAISLTTDEAARRYLQQRLDRLEQ